MPEVQIIGERCKRFGRFFAELPNVQPAWTFRNSRTPVKVVFENIEDGMTIEEIIEQYPVSREEIRAVLDFAAHSLDKEPSF